MFPSMPLRPGMTVQELHDEANREIARHRGFYIFEGIVFLALGLLAIAMPPATAIAVELLLGALLLAGGIMRFASGLSGPQGRVWRIISGLIFMGTGAAMLWWPIAGLSALVLVIGFFLIADGIMEILLALTYEPARKWGWLLVAGVLSLVLGALIFAGFPAAGFIYISVMLGISLGFYGIAMIALAAQAPESPAQAHTLKDVQ